MEDDAILANAISFQEAFGRANVKLVRKIDDLNAKKQEFEGLDLHDTDLRDPSIIAADVAAQIGFFRKLKFQYLEQNAKDKYVKSIVSNIDDAPIVTADDNRALQALNEQRKQKLKDAKTRLADIQNRIRELAPAVEKDYAHVKSSTAQAAALSQKIIDARLALSRLRQAHPTPRLTEQSATQTLAEQDVQIQELDDEKATAQNNVREVKDKVKQGTLEVEGLRIERAEVEKNVKVEVDDGLWLPLYDWFTQALSVHRSIMNMESLEASADNEIRLTYKIDAPERRSRIVSITLIFLPGTRHLASVEVGGLDDTDIDVTELIDAHVPSNDAPGVIAAILARVRTEA